MILEDNQSTTLVMLLYCNAIGSVCIENACSSAQGSSHVIIVGSHADWVESSRELKPEELMLVESKAESRVKHGGFVNMVGTSPTALIPVLYSKQLISDTDKTRLTTLTHTDNIDKATRLLNAVETKMKAEPRFSTSGERVV